MLLLGQSSSLTSQNWMDSGHPLKLTCGKLLVYYNVDVFFAIWVCATRKRPSTGFCAKLNQIRPWGYFIVFPFCVYFKR